MILFQYEFKAKGIKKKIVNIQISVEGVKVCQRKKKKVKIRIKSGILGLSIIATATGGIIPISLPALSAKSVSNHTCKSGCQPRQ